MYSPPRTLSRRHKNRRKPSRRTRASTQMANLRPVKHRPLPLRNNRSYSHRTTNLSVCTMSLAICTRLWARLGFHHRIPTYWSTDWPRPAISQLNHSRRPRTTISPSPCSRISEEGHETQIKFSKTQRGSTRSGFRHLIISAI